jgi:hypothetical protein
VAAGKFKLYDLAKKYIGDGTHDLDDTTNWKIALFLSTSNANTLSVGTNVYGDLTNEHANANGYTTGGVALSGVTWTNSGGTISFAYLSSDPIEKEDLIERIAGRVEQPVLNFLKRFSFMEIRKTDDDRLIVV